MKLSRSVPEDLIDIAHSRIITHPESTIDHVYGEFEAGGTSWMYLSPVDFKYSELPQLRADVIRRQNRTDSARDIQELCSAARALRACSV